MRDSAAHGGGGTSRRSPVELLREERFRVIIQLEELIKILVHRGQTVRALREETRIITRFPISKHCS